MAGSNEATLQQLVKALIVIVNEKQSGALIGMLVGKPVYVQLFVEMGTIVACRYDRLVGVDAIKKLKSAEKLKFGFHPNKIPESYDDLPSVAKILDFLVPGSASELQNKADLTVTHGNHDGIGQSTLHHVQNAFVSVVGPIGDVIFDREVVKSKTRSELIRNLEQHITFRDDKEAFHEAVKAQPE